MNDENHHFIDHSIVRDWWWECWVSQAESYCRHFSQSLLSLVDTIVTWTLLVHIFGCSSFMKMMIIFNGRKIIKQQLICSIYRSVQALPHQVCPIFGQYTIWVRRTRPAVAAAIIGASPALAPATRPTTHLSRSPESVAATEITQLLFQIWHR